MIKTIITHPGGAHKDDFLACAVLLSKFPVSILRRDPTDQELADPEIAVVDIGHQHNANLNNYDHHQFARDSDPSCALSLVLDQFGIYEDAKEFCSWLETTEWFDCRGPHETAEWLGVERETMAKLNSPIDVTIFQAFAKRNEHHSGEPIWEVMKMIGTDLVSFVVNLRKRMNQVAKHEEIWELGEEDQSMKIAFVPCTDPPIEDVSGGLAWRVKELGLEEDVVAMVYPDSRGEGYGMRRYNDSPVMDFSKLSDEPEVHFTHNRGFIAKTSCTEISKIKEMLLLARK
ncbi:MAG: MYG1 family protein [Verrucomicrobiota bacterium]|nr:MYG1 family protein [Verrucomicrobiota bacterium]